MITTATMRKEQQIHHFSYNNKSRLNDSEEHLYEAIDSPPSSSANLRRIMLNQTDKKGYKTKSDDLSFPTFCIKSDQMMAKSVSAGAKTKSESIQTVMKDAKLGEEKHEAIKKNNSINNLVKKVVINETNKELEFCLHSSSLAQKMSKCQNNISSTKSTNYTCIDSREDATFNTYNEPQQGFYKCHKNLSDINDFDIVPDFRSRMRRSRYLSSGSFILRESRILREKKIFQIASSRKHLLVNNTEDDDGSESRINLNNPHERSKILCCSKCNKEESANPSLLSSSCNNKEFCCIFDKNVRRQEEEDYKDGKNLIVVANFAETMNKYQPRRQKSNHIRNSSTIQNFARQHNVTKNYNRTHSQVPSSENSKLKNDIPVFLSTGKQDSNRSSIRSDEQMQLVTNNQSVPLVNDVFSEHFDKDNCEDAEISQSGLPMPPLHEPHQSCLPFPGMDLFLPSNKDYKSTKNSKKFELLNVESLSSDKTERTRKIKDDTESQILHTVKFDKNKDDGMVKTRSQFHGARTHLNIQQEHSSSNYASSKEAEDRCQGKLVNTNHKRLPLNDDKLICNNLDNNKRHHNMLNKLESNHISENGCTSPSCTPPPLPPKPKHFLYSKRQNNEMVKATHGFNIDENLNLKEENFQLEKSDKEALMTTKGTRFTLPSLSQEQQNKQQNLRNNASQTSYLCQLEEGDDDGVKEITKSKNKKDKTFIADNTRKEIAQSVQDLQKLSYDLLGLIDGQQKSHLRHTKESNFPCHILGGGMKNLFCEKVSPKSHTMLETNENDLQTIRTNTSVPDVEANEHNVTKLIHVQNIRKNLSKSTSNEPIVPNNVHWNSASRGIGYIDNVTSENSPRFDNLENSNKVGFQCNFENSSSKLSNVISSSKDDNISANHGLDLSFQAKHMKVESKTAIGSQPNSENIEVDSRRKLIFSPCTPHKGNRNSNFENEKTDVKTYQIKQLNKSFAFHNKSSQFQNEEEAVRSHKKKLYNSSFKKDRLRLISADRITKRKGNYGTNKLNKSSKLGHVSFMETLRSTSNIESPISYLIKKRMASSAICGGEQHIIPSNNLPCSLNSVNDVEKTCFNHSFEEDFKFGSEKMEEGDSKDCTPISSFKSTRFQSLHSRSSTPFNIFFRRRRNSTPLKGHNCKKKISFKLLESINSSTGQKINRNHSSNQCTDITDFGDDKKVNQLKECNLRNQNESNQSIGKNSLKNESKSKSKNCVSFCLENKENYSNTCNGSVKDVDNLELCSLPIIPFHHSSYTTSSFSTSSSPVTPIIKMISQKGTERNMKEKGSFDTYMEMTPKSYSELQSQKIRKLTCQSRQSFLMTRKNSCISSNLKDPNSNKNCISTDNNIVLEVTQNNQSEKSNVALPKNLECLENNNKFFLHSSCTSRNNPDICKINASFLLPNNKCTSLNDSVQPNTRLQSIRNDTKSTSISSPRNFVINENSTLEQELSSRCSEPTLKPEKCNLMIKDENQNQHQTSNCFIKNGDETCNQQNVKAKLKAFSDDEISSRTCREKYDINFISTLNKQSHHHPHNGKPLKWEETNLDKKTKCAQNGMKMGSKTSMRENNLKTNFPILSGIGDDSSTKIYLNIDDYVKMGNTTNFCF